MCYQLRITNDELRMMFDFLRNLTKSDEEKAQERLSAYLDDSLTPQEHKAFEEQLKADVGLQASLEQQRVIKQNVRALPKVRAPRNFTLDPALYGRPTSQVLFNLYPVMRTATALAAIVLVFLFSLDLFSARGEREDLVAEAPIETVLESSNFANEESAVEQAAPAAGADLFETAESEADVEAEEAMEEEIVEEESMEEAEAPAEAEIMLEEEPIVSDEASGEAAEDSEISTTATIEGETVLPFGGAGSTITKTPMLTSTQRLSQTTTLETENAYPPTNEPRSNLDDEAGANAGDETSTRRMLQIGLGLLFLALLTGTWLLRRQL